MRWIDLGCPIEIAFDGEPGQHRYGWMCDDNRPTLTVTHPGPDNNKVLSRILVGMHDYSSGLDLETFQVVADFPIDGVPAGENLADKFNEVDQGVWEYRLQNPILDLPKGELEVSVCDGEGNRTRLERTISIGQ